MRWRYIFSAAPHFCTTQPFGTPCACFCSPSATESTACSSPPSPPSIPTSQSVGRVASTLDASETSGTILALAVEHTTRMAGVGEGVSYSVGRGKGGGAAGLSSVLFKTEEAQRRVVVLVGNAGFRHVPRASGVGEGPTHVFISMPSLKLEFDRRRGKKVANGYPPA